MLLISAAPLQKHCKKYEIKEVYTSSFIRWQRSLFSSFMLFPAEAWIYDQRQFKEV